MAYFLDLFTPETWRAFRETDPMVTGFRDRQFQMATRVKVGDIFVCYLTRVKRWCGVLQAESTAQEDRDHLHDDLDDFPIRFKVKPLVQLEPENSIPIYGDDVWDGLSITKGHQRGTSTWTGFFRNSLNSLSDQDGEFLLQLLMEQKDQPREYPLSDDDRRKLTATRRVPTPSGSGKVEVEVPDDDEGDIHPDSGTHISTAQTDTRVSIQYQAKVAEIGAKMGFRIWVPRNDRARVLEHIPESSQQAFLDQLPLNYDDTTLRTIEQIDVLWLKGRSMARAFEIEHTTAIYSGLLRMADLLALQPNMDIRLHIVAPLDKQERVLRELRRPVFSLLDRGPLYDQCSYLSYESIDDLASTENLNYMKDAIISEYEESADI